MREHYEPHRHAIATAIGALIEAGQRVLHVASHSFTPVLDGVERRADVAWLYDPRRAVEAQAARVWMDAFARRGSGLRLRRNYPYRGQGDGLTAWLRTLHPQGSYAGIELEVNQRFVAQGGPAWGELKAQLVDSLDETRDSVAFPA